MIYLLIEFIPSFSYVKECDVIEASDPLFIFEYITLVMNLVQHFFQGHNLGIRCITNFNMILEIGTTYN